MIQENTQRLQQEIFFFKPTIKIFFWPRIKATHSQTLVCKTYQWIIFSLSPNGDNPNEYFSPRLLVRKKPRKRSQCSRPTPCNPQSPNLERRVGRPLGWRRSWVGHRPVQQKSQQYPSLVNAHRGFAKLLALYLVKHVWNAHRIFFAAPKPHPSDCQIVSDCGFEANTPPTSPTQPTRRWEIFSPHDSWREETVLRSWEKSESDSHLWQNPKQGKMRIFYSISHGWHICDRFGGGFALFGGEPLRGTLVCFVQSRQHAPTRSQHTAK